MEVDGDLLAVEMVCFSFAVQSEHFKRQETMDALLNGMSGAYHVDPGQCRFVRCQEDAVNWFHLILELPKRKELLDGLRNDAITKAPWLVHCGVKAVRIGKEVEMHLQSPMTRSLSTSIRADVTSIQDVSLAESSCLHDDRKLDMIVVVDCATSSPVIMARLKAQLKHMVDVILRRGLRFRLALISYKNHPLRVRKGHWLMNCTAYVENFTNDRTEMREHIQRLRCFGNKIYSRRGLADGLALAVRLSKNDDGDDSKCRKEANKVCILLPLEVQSRTLDIFKCTHGHDVVDLCRQLAENSVTLYTVLRKTLTAAWYFPHLADVMAEFFTGISLMTGGQFIFSQSVKLVSEIICYLVQEDISMERLFGTAHNIITEEVNKTGDGNVDLEELKIKLEEALNKRFCRVNRIAIHGSTIGPSSKSAQKFSLDDGIDRACRTFQRELRVREMQWSKANAPEMPSDFNMEDAASWQHVSLSSDCEITSEVSERMVRRVVQRREQNLTDKSGAEKKRFLLHSSPQDSKRAKLTTLEKSDTSKVRSLLTEQLPDGANDDDNDGGDDDGDGGNEDDNEDDVGNVGSKDVTEEQELPQQFHGLQLEGQDEHLEEQDHYKTKIDEEIVTSEGTYWHLKQEAVHLMFPANAVSEPTTIVVHKWKCSACSPPLQDHEAIVSNVIEISTINGQALEFNAEVKLFLSHSAPDLKGYEVVMKRQIDKECNEWEDVDRTQDLRSLSDIGSGCPCPNDIPDFFFPVAQAGITKCSTCTVVCRLKSSPPYTITSTGGYFSHPDYPGVTVTIPENAVAPEAKFSLQLKVQEVPNEEFEDQDMFLGPVLRIVRSQVHFLKPVTIQLPVSLRDEREGIPDPLTCRVRVFFLRTDGERKEWIEITDDLVNPASFDGTFVRFQVERFCRYSPVLDRRKESSSIVGIGSYLSRYNRNSPILAFFFAYFRPDSQDILLLICCPAHLRPEVIRELEKKDITHSEGSSRKHMIPTYDKAFVFVSGGIKPYCTKDMEELYLVFDSYSLSKTELLVRFVSNKGPAQVELHSTPKPSRKNLLCKLHLKVPSLSVDRTASEEVTRQPVAVKDGNPSCLELEGLSEKLPEHWEKLGRRLNFDDAKLKGYHKDNEEVAKKIYGMLKAWKEREGSGATFRVLYQALCDIDRKDLAQDLCCH